MNVDVFINISPRAPRAKNGTFEYVMVCNGQYRTGKGTDQDTTANTLAMKAVLAALSRMNRPALITIHTDLDYLITGHQSMESWAQNGWKKKNGQPLKNADLWKEIYEKQKGHAVRYRREEVQALFEDTKEYSDMVRVKALMKNTEQ